MALKNYHCKTCEDTRFIAGERYPDGTTMSWREVEKRKYLSRALRVWAEHMPKEGCPDCGADKPKPKPVVVKAMPKQKRKYTKKANYWGDK